MVGKQFFIRVLERAEIESFNSVIGRGKELSEYSGLRNQ